MNILSTRMNFITQQFKTADALPLGHSYETGTRYVSLGCHRDEEDEQSVRGPVPLRLGAYLRRHSGGDAESGGEQR